MFIPQSTSAAPGNDHAMLVGIDITNDIAGLVIPDDRPKRNRHDAVFAIASMAAGAFAGPAVLGSIMRSRCQGDQRVQGSIPGQDHVPALATIAPVGATARTILLASHADAAMTALTGANEYLCLVDEHGIAPGSSDPRQEHVHQPADRAGRSIAS